MSSSKICVYCNVDNQAQHSFCVQCGNTLTNAALVKHEHNDATQNDDELKADPLKTERVRIWIEAVLERKIDCTNDELCLEFKSGVVLCQLLNKIRPNSVSKINRANQPFLQLENLSRFLLGVKSVGVHESEIFEAVDLHPVVKQPRNIINCLWRLSECARENPKFSGPHLDLSHIDSSKKCLSLPCIEAAVNLSKQDTSVQHETNASLSPHSGATAYTPKITSANKHTSRRRSSQRSVQLDINKLTAQKAENQNRQRRLTLVEQKSYAARDVQKREDELAMEKAQTTMKQKQLDAQLVLRKAHSERLKIIETHHRELAEQQTQLITNLKKHHQTSLDQMRIEHDDLIAVKKREIAISSARLVNERKTIESALCARMHELESTLSGAQISESISRLEQHEADILHSELVDLQDTIRIHAAVEAERIRMEAEERAIYIVQSEAELSMRMIAQQINEQCDLELKAMRDKFEEQLAASDVILFTESMRQAKNQFNSFNNKLSSLHVDISSSSSSSSSSTCRLDECTMNNNVAVEQELREKLQRDLNVIRKKYEQAANNSEQIKLEEQANIEAGLRQDFDEELTRIRLVLERRVSSEVEQRAAFYSTQDKEIRVAQIRLSDMRDKLSQARTKQATSPTVAAKAKMNQEVKSLNCALKKTESETRVRVAVEAERNRIRKQAQVIELAKKQMKRSLHEAIQKMSLMSLHKSQDLERVRLLCELKEANLLDTMKIQDVSETQNEALIEQAFIEEEISRAKYEAEVFRLKDELEQSQFSLALLTQPTELYDDESHLELEATTKQGTRSQMSTEKRALKRARAELKLLKRKLRDAQIVCDNQKQTASLNDKVPCVAIDDALLRVTIEKEYSHKISELETKLAQARLAISQFSGHDTSPATDSIDGQQCLSSTIDSNNRVNHESKLQLQVKSLREQLKQAQQVRIEQNVQLAELQDLLQTERKRSAMAILVTNDSIRSADVTVPPPCVAAPPPPPLPAPPTRSGRNTLKQVDPHAALLAALKGPTTLKKASVREQSAELAKSVSSDPHAALFAAIQSGPKLKKASDRKLAEPKSSAKNTTNANGVMMQMVNMAQMAAKMAAARQKRMAEQ